MSSFILGSISNFSKLSGGSHAARLLSHAKLPSSSVKYMPTFVPDFSGSLKRGPISLPTARPFSADTVRGLLKDVAQKPISKDSTRKMLAGLSGVAARETLAKGVEAGKKASNVISKSVAKAAGKKLSEVLTDEQKAQLITTAFDVGVEIARSEIQNRRMAAEAACQAELNEREVQNAYRQGYAEGVQAAQDNRCVASPEGNVTDDSELLAEILSQLSADELVELFQKLQQPAA